MCSLSILTTDMLNQRLYHLFLITTLSIAARAETSQDITDLFEYRFVELWEHGDAAGIASLWVSDGDWSNVIGSRRIQRGRAAVESVWTIGLQGRDRPEDRAIHVRVDNIRQLGKSHALVDVMMAFVPDGENPIREAFVFVVRPEGEVSRIVSARTARLPGD